MMKPVSGLAALLLLACGTASAADLDYSFLDLAYSKQSHDQLSGGSGYQLTGSYALTDGFFISAIYKHNDFDDDSNLFPRPSYSNHSYQLGGGYHYSLSASTDLVTRITYGRANSNTSVGSFSAGTGDHSGYDLGIGLRGRPAAGLELEAFLDHDDLGFYYNISPPCVGVGLCIRVITSEPNGSENVVSAGSRYYFLPSFALGAEYRHSSLQSANEWQLYGRWSF